MVSKMLYQGASYDVKGLASNTYLHINNILTVTNLEFGWNVLIGHGWYIATCVSIFHQTGLVPPTFPTVDIYVDTKPLLTV